MRPIANGAVLMPQADDISLSFFALSPQDFHFPIYTCTHLPRTVRNEEGVHTYKLPSNDLGDCQEEREETPYEDFLVSFEQRPNFDKRICSSADNFLLTRRYLYVLLQTRCEESLTASDYETSDSYGWRYRSWSCGTSGEMGPSGFRPTCSSPKGSSVSSPILASGNPDVPFDRKTLQLSHSLMPDSEITAIFMLIGLMTSGDFNTFTPRSCSLWPSRAVRDCMSRTS